MFFDQSPSRGMGNNQRRFIHEKNYEFGMLVLDVNDKGEGEGLLYGACRVKFTKDDQVEVEHFGQAPARLAAVKLWQ
jgi:hypothetical protein